MTPKETAYLIYDKIANVTDGLNKYPMCHDTAKQCALIAVDEVIKYAKRWGDMADDDIREFEQVKEEINKL